LLAAAMIGASVAGETQVGLSPLGPATSVPPLIFQMK